MPSRTNIPEEVWEYHKPCIQDLYINRDLTLKDVNKELRKRGFAASNQQYARQFKKWRVNKNLKAHEWRYISSVLHNRSLQGKLSIVFAHDQEVPVRKQYRGVHRHNRPLLLPPDAEHMSHIRICTPTSIDGNTTNSCASVSRPSGSGVQGSQAIRRESISVSVMLEHLPSWEMADMLDQSCMCLRCYCFLTLNIAKIEHIRNPSCERHQALRFSHGNSTRKSWECSDAVVHLCVF